MNILTKSILTLAALAATGLHAEVFPIAEDTFGTIAKGTILKASGAAKSVTVSAKTKAYVSFDVGNSGIPASSVTSARLTIYVARATKTGTLFLANANAAFSETFSEKSIAMPSDSIISTTGLTDASSREFITFDVTNQVKAWLTTPSSEHGFVLAADGTLSVTLATKEGAGTGHPAVLEVDVASAGGNILLQQQPDNNTPGAALTLAAGSTSSSGVPFLAQAGGNLILQAGNGFNSNQDGANGGSVVIRSGANWIAGSNSTRNGGDIVLETGGASGTFAERMRVLASSGNVGIGTATPGSRLSVNGQIETQTGGIKFPNGSIQTKAAPGTGSGSQFINYGPGSFINEDTNNRVVNSLFDGVWTTSGILMVPLNLPSGARVLSIKAYVNDTAAGVNLRVSNLTKISTGFNSVGSAFDFVVNAGTSGYFNQTGTQNFDYIIASDRAEFIIVEPVGGNWPGNATLAVQNITVEWIMP